MKCFECGKNLGLQKCEAYPDGIPSAIYEEDGECAQFEKGEPQNVDKKKGKRR